MKLRIPFSWDIKGRNNFLLIYGESKHLHWGDVLWLDFSIQLKKKDLWLKQY